MTLFVKVFLCLSPSISSLLHSPSDFPFLINIARTINHICFVRFQIFFFQLFIFMYT